MKITVKVTKEILERSKMSGFLGIVPLSKNCAVAMACQEILPGCSVGIHTISDNRSYIMEMPVIAEQFIKKFDRCSPTERVQMKPISFEIDVPDEIIEEIGIEEVRQILTNSETLEYAK